MVTKLIMHERNVNNFFFIIKFIMFKRKVSTFIFYLCHHFFYLLFINNQSKQRKMLKHLHIRWYSYQLKEQFYFMNSVLVCVNLYMIQ